MFLTPQKTENSLTSHRAQLRNISNGSHRKIEQCNAVDLGPSPRESPRLHLRSNSSRVASFLVLADKTEKPSRNPSSAQAALSMQSSLDVDMCATEHERVADTDTNVKSPKATNNIWEDHQQSGNIPPNHQHEFSPTPDYNPYRVQIVPRQRPYQPYISIHNLESLAASPFGLYNPYFQEIRASLNTFPIEHTDMCSSWSQMSIDTAELLFVVQQHVVYEIEMEAQSQLQDIENHDRTLRQNAMISEDSTHHLICFDLDAVIYHSTVHILEHASSTLERSSTVLERSLGLTKFEAIGRVQGLVELFITSLRCIEWVQDAHGRNHGVMEVEIIATDFPTCVQAVKHHDTISLGNDTSLVVREGQEILLFPEYRRYQRLLENGPFRSIRFELGNDLPWLKWDPLVCAFRGETSYRQTNSYLPYGSRGINSVTQSILPDPQRQTITVIIKASILERSSISPRSELRLKTVLRAKINLDILPWWSDTEPPPWTHSSLRDARRPSVSSPAPSTVPRCMKSKAVQPSNPKPLLDIFRPPSRESPSCPPGFSPEMRGRYRVSRMSSETNSTWQKLARGQPRSSRVFSFEGDSECNFVTRKVEDPKIGSCAEQNGAPACSIRLVQPSAMTHEDNSGQRKASWLLHMDDEFTGVSSAKTGTKRQFSSQSTCSKRGCTSDVSSFVTTSIYHLQRNEPERLDRITSTYSRSASHTSGKHASVRSLRRQKRKRLARNAGAGSVLQGQKDTQFSDWQRLQDFFMEKENVQASPAAMQVQVGGRFAPLLDIASREPSHSSLKALAGVTQTLVYRSKHGDIGTRQSSSDSSTATRGFSPNPMLELCADERDAELGSAASTPRNFSVPSSELVDAEMRQIQEFWEKDKLNKLAPQPKSDISMCDDSDLEVLIESDSEDNTDCDMVDEAKLEGVATSPRQSEPRPAPFAIPPKEDKGNVTAAASDGNSGGKSNAASDNSLSSDMVVDDIELLSIMGPLQTFKGGKKRRCVMRHWGARPGKFLKKMSPRRN